MSSASESSSGNCSTPAKPQGSVESSNETTEFCGELLTLQEIESIQQAISIPVNAPVPRQLSPHDPLLPYRSGAYSFRVADHKGQRKLLMSEVDFLTRNVGKDSITVVYPGSAPGEHIPLLATLFPKIEFHLYDPAPFRIRSNHLWPSVAGRIQLCGQMFGEKEARRYAGWGATVKVLFISDIRSGSPFQEEFESEVWANMEAQKKWYEIIRPKAALLKFRLPYTDGKSTVMTKYLAGSVRHQPWAPLTSTEGRLEVTVGSLAEYDSTAYEKQCFHRNLLRDWWAFDHGLPLNLVPGLDRCFDCALEVAIWRDYVRKYPDASFKTENEHVASLMLAASEISGYKAYSLDRPPHGMYPDLPAMERRKKLHKEFSEAFTARRAKRAQRQKGHVQYAVPSVQQQKTKRPQQLVCKQQD
jgi:hypothetical protein